MDQQKEKGKEQDQQQEMNKEQDQHKERSKEQDRQKERGYAMSLDSQVNMTNCYKHCEHFFQKCKSVHFNVLIAYWIMAGYLGPVDSVEEAYQKGHDILLDLVYDEKIIKSQDEDPEMIEFVDSDPKPCRHLGFCTAPTLGFVNLLKLDELSQLRNVVCTDGMLKTVRRNSNTENTQEQQMVPNNTKKQRSVLLIDGNHLSRQVFHPVRRLKYLAYFNPRSNSLGSLLKNVKHLSVLLLRGCELLPQSDFSFEKFKALTVLEISSSSHLTTIPHGTISKLTQLRCLNLSHLPIENLPDDFFSNLVELCWVILRGCSKLGSLPTTQLLKKLQALDLSHCTALEELKCNVLPNTPLQMLDLSYTAMGVIPYLHNTKSLTHLFLRNSKASVLNTFRQITTLLVLDLSGAESVREVPLKGNTNLVVLDLSRTKITSINFLPNMTKLRNLKLQGCKCLGKLQELKNLVNLEVLDISGCNKLDVLPEDLSELRSLKELNLSGCSGLKDLSEGLFDQMSCLEKLDLSEIKVNCLPSFAKLTSLCKLSLKDLQLDSFETLASLSNLVELELNGLKISSSQELDLVFLESLEKLQILDLSETSMAQLPNLSKLICLRKLILTDCQQLKIVPDLQELTNLETLDLSLRDRCIAQTEIEGQTGFNLSVPSSLQKLVLTNRSGVQPLFPLTTLGEMENLDLRGTDLAEIPYENMGQAKCIQLPATIDLSGVRFSRMGNLPKLEVLNGDPQGGNLQEPITIASAKGSKSSLSAGTNQFFHLKEEEGSQGTWEAFFPQFSVFLPPKESEDKFIYLDEDEFILRGDRSWARRLLNLELKGRSVEIQVFSKFPDVEDIRNVLQEANNVAFVGKWKYAEDIRNAEDVPNAEDIRNPEDIRNDEDIRNAKDIKNAEDIRNPEDIRNDEDIRNAKDIQNAEEIQKDDDIRNAEDIRNVLCSLIKKMEVCCIRRCPKMGSVLEEKNGKVAVYPERLVLSDLSDLEFICAENVSSQSLESLKHIHIDCCPKLTKVITASQVPKNLETLHIKFCDRLQTLVENISLTYLQELSLFELPKLKGIEADLPKLQILSIGQCPGLKNLDRLITTASTSLTRLCLDSCPHLEHVLPSSPVLQILEVLKISSCSGLVTLFDKAGPSSSSLPELFNLQTLKLRNLPKFNSIGGKLSLVSTPDLDPCLPPSIGQDLCFPLPV